MKPNPIALVLLSTLLAACSPPQAPAPAAPTPDQRPAAAPAAPAAATATVPAATAMGKRAAGDATPPMTVFRAFGNEPFWNVNVEGVTLTFSTPEDQAGVVMQGERRTLANGVEITGMHDGKSFGVRVITGICSDGMSDTQHSLVSNFRYGDVNYKGCGEPAM